VKPANAITITSRIMLSKNDKRSLSIAYYYADGLEPAIPPTRDGIQPNCLHLWPGWLILGGGLYGIGKLFCSAN
jgi:hypothetical protein